MNFNNIIVFDEETTGVSPKNNEVVQLAALVVDGRSLDIIEGSEFNSLMKPLKLLTDEDWQKSQGAFNVNKLKREDLEAAPHPKEVWGAFVSHVKKYSIPGRKADKWSAPIASGFNIQGFDLYFIEELCKLYGPINKDGRPELFYPMCQLDVANLCFLWWENNKEIERIKLDWIRDYVGVSEEEKATAHNALVDVQFTAHLLIKFLKLNRHYSPRVKFKNSFKV